MSIHLTTRSWLLFVAMAAAACGSTSTTSAPPSKSEAPQPQAQAQQPPEAQLQASAPAAPAATATPAVATVALAAAPAVDAASPEMVRKRAQIEWALKQDELKNDPHDQWAVQAKASSSYNDAQGATAHSASQATGAPDVEIYGNNSGAWSPKTPNAGIEWLEVTYAKPVYATAVRIRESYGPGAVIKVEVFDEQGAPHAVWSGLDPTKEMDYLTVQFARTAFKTSRVKVTLATNTVPGYKQIDAVQLVGTGE
ncbi:MAG TPA: hypothetical protein VH583_07875 [Vicinamibacterales bacterium]|jgi:hypothetical protein